MSNERIFKVGRKAELEELLRARRIEVDLLVRAVRDLFEPRDDALAYTEKIDIYRMKVYMKEIERKYAELSKIAKDLAIVKSDLDGE
jgi:hypothetical protein